LNRGGRNARLNAFEDEALKRYMDFLCRIGMPPDKRAIVKAANLLLEDRGEARVSKDWGRRWLLRNKEYYKNIRSKTLHAERKAIHHTEEIELHFRQFNEMMVTYDIEQNDVWNFDEIGFRIGCLRGRMVIVPADVKAIYLADPDNRESITALECCSAGGRSIAPFLILKGDILLEKHFKNQMDNKAKLACSPTGFTNDRLTYQWLEHFNELTRSGIGQKWRALIMDGHGSHLSDHFKFYAFRNRIVPFLLPSHSTHLLQPLDVGVFSAMKQHHQNALYDSIRYGDYTFDRTDFLAAFQEIHNCTTKKRTIIGAFIKTGLFPFNPEVVLREMAHFEGHSEAPIAMDSVDLPLQPCTPPLRPFQQPPTTRTRETHEKYLEQRILDHIDGICSLSPSYSTSLQSYYEFTARKAKEIRLIEQNEANRQEQAKAKAALRVGGSRYVQKSGAISFGQARAQIQERATEEWIQEGRKEVVNFAEQRATRAQIKRGAKVERALQKKRERLQQEDQLERKEAVKLAVSVLEKAITRLGLRVLVQQSTNNLTSDFWKPLEWHIKHKGELWDQQRDMQATIDKYIEWRVRWLGVLWDLRPVGAGTHVFCQKMAEKAMLRKRGLGIQQKLKLDQKNGVYYYHLIEGNMPYYPLFQEVDFN
jgi:DDE superfamily endonuclease